MTVRVDKQEARAALASLNESLRLHADVLATADPAEIAEAAHAIMTSVNEDLMTILKHFESVDHFGLDDLSLRDLLLAGDSVIVPFLTPGGPARLTVALDAENPVSLLRAPKPLMRSWHELNAD